MFYSSLASELGDKMALGGKISLLGVLVVFLLLTILVLVLKCFDLIYKYKTKNPEKIVNLSNKFTNFKSKLKIKKKKTESETDNSEKLRLPINQPVISVDCNYEDSQTVAAIVGALSVVLTSDCNRDDLADKQFIVKKINKLKFRR